jgi:hypothetical protein
MLDVDGGVDINAGRQQFLDILPALGVARQARWYAPVRPPRLAAAGVSARRRYRTPRSSCRGIRSAGAEAAQGRAPAPRSQRACESRYSRPAHRHQRCAARGRPRARRRFCHTRRCAKEDLQSPARFLALIGLDAREQQVGIGTMFHIYILNQKCRQRGIRNTRKDIKIV